MAPDAISIDLLEKWVSSLDRAANAKSLKGVSFEKTYNESLGLSSHKTSGKDDFTVFIPFGSWDEYENPESTWKKYPSQLQKSFFDVIAKAQETQADSPFMDMATLVPHAEFFNEKGGPDLIGGKSYEGQSVAKAIADWVDSQSRDKTPVVRLLIGDDNPANDHTKPLADEPVTNIFWPRDEKTGNRVALVQHPKARIYVGYYNPNFHPKDQTSGPIKLITDLIQSVTSKVPGLEKMMKPTDIKDLADYLVVTGLRTVSWNHGKLLAVNGRVAMTGGGNYWNEYSTSHTGTPHDIIDHQAKVVGDAAVSAHKWADYFWTYLREPADTDEKSTWWGAYLNDQSQNGGPTWIARQDAASGEQRDPPLKAVSDGKLPANASTSPTKPWVQGTNGKPTVFTVSKMGNWLGIKNEGINYPMLIIDAVRDVLLNILWQSHAKWSDDGLSLMRFGLHIFEANKLLGDDVLNSTLFQAYGINPTAWAGRYTRTWAIASAKHSVIICQQMLGQTLQKGEADYDKLVAKVNDKIEAKGDPKMAWDGTIWPIDHLIAIAKAVGNIWKTNASSPDTGKFSGVFIVLTTKTPGARTNWDDKSSIKTIIWRIRRIMKGLPSSEGGLPDKDIDTAIGKYLHFKRVLKDDGTMYQHSKIVCVDRKVMYIGSDNAYPCYNEEHGIWVEDTDTVNTWLTSYFERYWPKCSDPVHDQAITN